MSIKSTLTQIQEILRSKIELNAFAKNEKGEVGGNMLKVAIVAIVALVVIVILGTALLPGAIDSLSVNMTQAHPSWSSGTTSVWNALAIFVVLVFLLILVAMLLAVLG
jgi:type II secretory pathway component PulF